MSSPDSPTPFSPNHKQVFSEERDVYVFDLDNTLYPAESNLFSQVDVKIGEYVQQLLGLDAVEARKLQKSYLVNHGTTLKGLMTNHDIDPHHYLDYVHDIDMSPIRPDPGLRRSLEAIDGRRLVFTNADQTYAEQVLERIGISDLIEGVFDIHKAGLEPKPKPQVYDMFLKEYGVDPNRAIMFEDMVRNLVPAHNLGMATVWINTGSVWGQADYDASKVHSETEGLAQWLRAHLGE